MIHARALAIIAALDRLDTAERVIRKRGVLGCNDYAAPETNGFRTVDGGMLDGWLYDWGQIMAWLSGPAWTY